MQRYADIREKVQDGDLIAVRSSHGGLPAVTRWVTRSPYTHTAMAVWCGERLLVAQMNAGGDGLVPLSRYQGVDFDVFPAPVDPGLATAALFTLLGTDINYGFIDLLRIGGHELLGIPLPPRDVDGLICSALSATIYLHAGWYPAGLPSIPAPRDIVAAIGLPPRFEVRRD